MSVAETSPAQQALRECPYLGLGFYTEENARWFFGRDHERQRIIGNLRAARLTVLYAESGVGKSSLLRAGVAARLEELARERTAKQGSPGYIPVVFSAWGDEPTEQLIAEIEHAIEPFLLPRASTTLPREQGLDGAIEAATRPIEATLLLVLDQFEEYFLYSARETRAGRFAEELSRCLGRSDLRANVLIALREDAYAGLGDVFKGKLANVYGNYLHLERLDQKAAREAIERPVEIFNSAHDGDEPIALEPALVDAVLEQVRAGEVGRKQGGLGGVAGRDGAVGSVERFETPYLQLVMTRLWQSERERGSRLLRVKTLDELGGAEEIVKTHLDDALSSLTAQERETAIDVFHYLVTPSGTKVAHAIADLPEYSGHSSEEVNALIGKLERGEQRILRQVAAPPGSSDGPRIEIFHDVLADAILDWRNRQIPARLEREKLAAEEQKQAAEERARRDRRRSLILLALLALVVLVGLVAFSFWRSAVAGRNTAQSRQLAADAVATLARNPELSTLLALSALHKSRTSQAEEALRKALPLMQLRRTLVPGASISDAAYSRNGQLIATAESDGIARVWDAASHRQLAALGQPGQSLNSVVFSPNEKLLATAGQDGMARVWSLSTHRQVGAPIHDVGYRPLHSVAFSPDGSLLLTASEDGTARIWKATQAAHREVGVIGSGKEVSINDAQFSPDGTQIVTAQGERVTKDCVICENGTAQIWSVAAGQRPHYDYTIPQPYGEPLLSASFSPDGRSIVTTSFEGSARIWKAARPPQPSAVPLPLPLPSEAAFGATDSAAFSPDSKLVVVAGSAGAWIFEARSHRRVATIAARGALAMNTAVYAPDGEHVLTAGADASARIWDVPGMQKPGLAAWSEARPALVGGGRDALQPAAFSSDGKLIAAAGRDGAVSVWEAESGRRVAEISEPGRGAINALAFEPNDSRMLLTASADGAVTLWNLASGSGREIATSNPSPLAVAFSPRGNRFVVAAGYRTTLYETKGGTVIRGFEEPSHEQISEVAFNPEGTKFITAGPDGAYLWNIGGGSKPLGRIPATAPLETARFSPDGKLIVTAGDDGTAREWNVPGLTPRGVPMTEPGYAIVRDAEFSADGSRILTASTDGISRIWDAATQRLLISLAGHSGRIFSASFSPASGANLVATSSSDGSLKLWLARPSEQRGSTLSMEGSFPTRASFSPDGSEIVTAGSDGVARIWDASSHSQLEALGRPGGAGLQSAAFSADAKLIVTAGDDGEARIWNLDTGRELQALPASRASRRTCPRSAEEPPALANAPLNDAAFSPRDSQLVVTANREGEADVWRGKSQVGIICVLGGRPLTSASFSADGRRILTTSSDGTARIWTEWNLQGAKQLAVLSEPGGDNLNAGAFSADGKLVVTASNDGTARVWNASTGAQEAVLSEPGASPVRTASFSPDGSELLTGSVDGAARIWAWKSERILTEFPVGDEVLDASFASRGDLLVTASRLGAQVWSTELAAPINVLERIAKQRLTGAVTSTEEAPFGVG
jgi:WD40 repeat protein